MRGASPPFDAGVAIIRAYGLQLDHAVYGKRIAKRQTENTLALSEVALLDLLRELAGRLRDAEAAVSLVATARQHTSKDDPTAQGMTRDFDETDMLREASETVGILLSAVEQK